MHAVSSAPKKRKGFYYVHNMKNNYSPIKKNAVVICENITLTSQHNILTIHWMLYLSA